MTSVLNRRLHVFSTATLQLYNYTPSAVLCFQSYRNSQVSIIKYFCNNITFKYENKYEKFQLRKEIFYILCKSIILREFLRPGVIKMTETEKYEAELCRRSVKNMKTPTGSNKKIHITLFNPVIARDVCFLYEKPTRTYCWHKNYKHV